MKTIKESYDEIMSGIAGAAREAGRDERGVCLTAVSKKQLDSRVDAVLALGHRCFGENRVQEAQLRWEKRRAAFPDLELRLIGPLQSNKTQDAVSLFDVIETVDRSKLARALKAAEDKMGRRLSYFIQVNTGEEPQKAGVLPKDLGALYRLCVNDCGLNVVGLMCIPPVDEPAGLHFGLLKTLAAGLGLSHLSMGMSGDYEQAIAFGATHIRVGSALFGAREDG